MLNKITLNGAYDLYNKFGLIISYKNGMISIKKEQ